MRWPAFAAGGNALLRRPISPGRSTLAAAILLGAREQLDPERNEGYLVTGTIHVLSISGLHVGILAWGFWVVLRHRPGAAAAGDPGRDAADAGLRLADRLPAAGGAGGGSGGGNLPGTPGRPRGVRLQPAGLAGLVVLAYHPASLFLAGPQLSFLAVAAMILFSPLLLPQPILDPLDRLIAQTRPLAGALAADGRRHGVAALADRGDHLARLAADRLAAIQPALAGGPC